MVNQGLSGSLVTLDTRRERRNRTSSMYKTPLSSDRLALFVLNFPFDMRAIIIIVAAIAGSAFGQSAPYRHRSSQDAAILSDARYLAGDGTFGAAYTQEDGVEFKEESDANGDRKGSYSYVDPNGHRRTVFYTAGKNGFQVRDELEASGDHIPTARPVVAPQLEYEPLPQYNPPDYRPPQRQYRAQAPPQSHYAQESIYQPQPTPQPQYYPRPQYRPLVPTAAPPPPPPSPQYRPEPQLQYRPQSRPVFQPTQLEYEPEPQYQPRPESFQYQPRPQYHTQPAPRPRPQYNELTTPPPRRFHPPGKLDFNRTPDGFSYTFSKS